MLDIEDRPLCLLQRLHLDELSGGMHGLYELLATSKRRGKDEPAEKIRGMSLSKQDLCAAFGLFVEKLDKMRAIDDRLRYGGASEENSAPPQIPQPCYRAAKRLRRHAGKKHPPAP